MFWEGRRFTQIGRESYSCSLGALCYTWGSHSERRYEYIDLRDRA